MQIKFKKLHALAQIPRQAHPTDAGFDLVATTKEYDDLLYVHYGTGIAVEIPEGFVGLVFPRSSIYKTGLALSNSVGVIDSGYRGEIKAVFDSTLNPGDEYEPGDRIAQLLIVALPRVEFVAADELTESDRGANGYGSTGK